MTFRDDEITLLLPLSLDLRKDFGPRQAGRAARFNAEEEETDVTEANNRGDLRMLIPKPAASLQYSNHCTLF